jgi:hypothetical protein
MYGTLLGVGACQEIETLRFVCGVLTFRVRVKVRVRVRVRGDQITL